MTRELPATNLDTLRPFDAAPASTITETTTIRSDARLEQILATPHHAVQPFVAAPSRRASSRVRALRWAAIPVAAAAAIGIGIALPGGVGVASAHASLATWTAHGSALEGDQLAAADESCRELEHSVSPQASPALLLGEQRGDWAFLAYANEPGSEDPTVMSCLVWIASIDDAQVVSIYRSTGAEDLIGSDGEFVRSVSATVARAYQVPGISPRQEATANLVDGGAITMLIGRLDDDVAALSVQTPNNGEVAATVSDGWYVAWWPGDSATGYTVTNSVGDSRTTWV